MKTVLSQTLIKHFLLSWLTTSSSYHITSSYLKIVSTALLDYRLQLHHQLCF